MTSPENRPYIGVAVIVVREGRVLLGKRRNAHGAGTWQFPGGHLEFGESIEACARRELFEETGLSALSLRRGPFTNDLFEDEGKHYVTLFLISEHTVGRPRLKEPDKCECWEWFSWSEMPEPHFLPIVNLLKQGFSIPQEPSVAASIKSALAAMGDPQRAREQRRFFKTGPGAYAEGDLFLGIKVPELRKLAGRHADAGMDVVADLLHSPVHEHRHLALFLLIQRFQNGGMQERGEIVEFYLANTAWVNNWDLVDCSAHTILGAFLHDRDRDVLYRLVDSQCLWERRIAIVATWHFIRTGQVADTFKLAALLLDDDEDLIHKSVGWMLREAGKRDEAALVAFIERHYRQMPRTMLRYAIERFEETRRLKLLRGQFGS
jgi:3-methyladenine DNA glycosylase AlkD/ADP-ribose pyrophosphatase YjhB (NUDIX family)